MRRSAWMAALAALAAGCGGLEEGTASEAMMGRNGVGPNLMGRNSFVPGGIASNGLGPNYAAQPLDVVQTSATEWSIRNLQFESWFRANPVEHEKAMGYFTRCMLPEGYALTFGANPATGLPYRWAGQYGVAAESLLAGQRMTRDEGLWMSSCMLAHVNTKGTHQYISIRGAKLVPGLATSDGEHWSMRMYHGAYLADLFTVEPLRWACQQPRGACSSKDVLVCTPPPWYLDIVLGRSCDGYTCDFFNTLTGRQEVLVQNVGWCGDPAAVRRKDDAWSPLYSFASGGIPAATGPELRPIFVNGPVFVDFELGLGAPATAKTPGTLFEVLSTGTVPLSEKQVGRCRLQSCLRPLWDAADDYGRKLAGLVPGNAIEAIVRYLPTMWSTGLEPRAPQIAAQPDMKTQFTAIFRYSNGKTALGRQAAAVAGVAVSDTARQYRKISALWPVTYDSGGKPSWDAYQYLQIWPVTGTFDAAKAGANPFLMAGVFGISSSASCTGPAPAFGTPTCVYGDSPQLDAVAFVPGKPWCMPAGATSFVGVCPD